MSTKRRTSDPLVERSMLAIPARLSRETRAALPDPGISIAIAHDAVAEYRAARDEEKAAGARVEEAKRVLLPIARQAFASLWVKRGARPKPPVVLVNKDGDELPFIVEEREAAALPEKAAHALHQALNDDLLYVQIVSCSEAIEFDAELLGRPHVKAMLLKAIAESDLPEIERAKLVGVVRRHRFRLSSEGALHELAARGADTLAAGLAAVSGVVRQYFQTS